jgi:hypothetical protein
MAIVSNARFLEADTKLLAEVFLDGTIIMAMTGTQAMEALYNYQTYKTFGDWFIVKQENSAISCIKEKCTLAEDLKHQVVTKMTLHNELVQRLGKFFFLLFKIFTIDLHVFFYFMY